MVGRGGVEPPTFHFSGGRSYQLSYLPNAREAYRPWAGRSESGGGPRVGSYAAPVSTIREPDTVLLEREAELDLLTSLLRRAREGEGGGARLLGPAGVGKTALVRRLAGLAAEQGMGVLVASAGQLESRSPYGVVRRLFDRPLIALADDEREALADGPARVAVAHVLGAATDPVDQGDLLNALYWLLDGLAARTPLLMVVDDAQWADEDSLLFLGSLRERLRALPVALVVTAREVAAEERGPALAALVADRDAVVLELGALSTPGVGALLASTWDARVDDEVVEAAAEVTGGNPFLVLALARLLVPDESERTADQVRAAVPGSVVDSVVDRMSGLTEEDQALVRAVAVLDAAPTRIAGTLAGLDQAEAERSADRLRRAGLLAEDAGLAFRHALLRSAVYAATGADAREGLHRAAARLLADDPHAAAGHLTASSGTADPWAVELLRAAAQDAVDEGAPQSAIALLDRALTEPPDAATLPGVLLELGLAQMRIADPACVETLGRAETLLRDPADLARCVLALGQAYSYAGFHEAAAEILERAHRVVAEADRELGLEVEATLIAVSLLVPARIADARRRLAAHRDLTGATRGERLMLVQQMANAAGTNQPAETIRGYALLVLGNEDGPEAPETTEWVWIGIFLLALGDHVMVRRLTDEGLTEAEARGSVIGEVSARYLSGLCEQWAGSLPAAEDQFRRVLELGSSLNGGTMVQVLGTAGLAHVLALQGQLDEALEILAELPEELTFDAPVAAVVGLCYARAIARQLAGDHEGALRAAEYVARVLAELDVDSPTWAAWREFAVGPLRSLGRLDDARRTAAEHLALCERSGVRHVTGEALRLAGLVAEDPAEAMALLRRSVELLDGSQSRLAEGQARVALGAALRRAGRRTEARDQLLAGRAVLVSIGAGALVTAADEELVAAGVRRTRLASRGGLTPSERRVAELAVAGLRNQEIARRLFVSPKTVETHLSRAYRKLGISGREQLAGALGDPA